MDETEKRLREEVRKLMGQGEAADKEEDKRYGRDRRGDELPEELQRRETRIARIREARRALEERAREQARSEGKDAKNAQPAQAANDKQQLAPLVEKIEEQSGQKPQEVIADNGYCSEKNLQYLKKRKIEGFVATGKPKHNERRKPCKPGPLSKGASRVEHMQRKLETQAGAAVYATRKFIVEPVFGQIKQERGFRQFLLRGLEKVRGEWALICMTHNILKFHKIICSG